jgi:hypothetical protein
MDLLPVTLASQVVDDELYFGVPAFVQGDITSLLEEGDGGEDSFVRVKETGTLRFQLTAAAGRFRAVGETFGCIPYNNTLDDSAANAIFTRPISLEPASSLNLELARTWLKRCAYTHKSCLQANGYFMPTRLIRITAGASWPVLQLQETSRMEAKRYAALSYCWGGPQEVRTNLDSYRQHATRINIGDLPDSIQGAVFVAIELGLEYIWIDALCIIQDDTADRDIELALMPSIYSQATVTISASRASSVKDGFVQGRNAHIERAFKLPYQCSNGDIGSVIFFPQILRPIEPLDQRGWALQEKLLSTKILDYGTLQTRWICRETTRSQDRGCDWVDGWKPKIWEVNEDDKLFQETLEAMRRENFLLLSQSADREDALTRWYRILLVYTQRSLSLSTDRLPAIAGVAERLGRVMNDQYLAGLWKSDLARGLLWQRSYPNTRKPQPTPYQGPSWSWAAIDGKIDFGYPSTKPHSSFKFLGSDVSNKFSAIQSGTLFLEALLRPAEWRPSLSSELLRTTDGLALDMSLDTLDPGVGNEASVAVFLLPLGMRFDRSRGLVLHKVGEKRFSRLGIFEFDKKSMQRIESKLKGNDQLKSYEEPLAWLEKGETERFELV